MSAQLNELRLQVERLDYDNKESIITIDILREQNQDAKSELDELKKIITELRSAQKDASAEDKEKRKQEKMALMMAKFDAVGDFLGKEYRVAHLRFSKAHSRRKMNNFANFWLGLIPWTLMQRCLRSPWMMWWRQDGSSAKHNPRCGRLWTV